MSTLPTTAAPVSDTATLLVWRVHLLRRRPERLPVVILVYLIASGSVWLMFRNPLPVLAALLLLTGAIREYWFPIEYRLTETSVSAIGLASPLALEWSSVQRVVPRRAGVLLTPVPFPSRLDSFRGIYLRYAPAGETGDKTSVTKYLAERIPDKIAQTQAKTTAKAEQ